MRMNKVLRKYVMGGKRHVVSELISNQNQFVQGSRNDCREEDRKRIRFHNYPSPRSFIQRVCSLSLGFTGKHNIDLNTKFKSSAGKLENIRA